MRENNDIRYLNYYFNSLELNQFITGSAQPKLTQANLNKIQVPCTNIDIQIRIRQEIESHFSVCDHLAKTLEENLQKAESLRQSILKQVFEGKLTENWRKKN